MRALGERELQLVEIGAARDELRFGQLGVALQQRTDALVCPHPLTRFPFGPHPLTPSPFRRGGTIDRFPGRRHAASTEISTSASGSRSTCATSVIARAE